MTNRHRCRKVFNKNRNGTILLEKVGINKGKIKVVKKFGSTTKALDIIDLALELAI